MESGMNKSGPDISENRIQVSNYTADNTHDYEYKLRSQTINIDCIPISQIWIEYLKTQNLNPKSNIVYIPQTQISL